MAIDNVHNHGHLHAIVEGVKEAVLWLGRQIQMLYKEYGIPAANALFTFLKTGNGIACLGASTGIYLLITAFQTNEHDSELYYSTATRIILCSSAIFCFLGAGVALTSGAAVLI